MCQYSSTNMCLHMYTYSIQNFSVRVSYNIAMAVLNFDLAFSCFVAHVMVSTCRTRQSGARKFFSDTSDCYFIAISNVLQMTLSNIAGVVYRNNTANLLR